MRQLSAALITLALVIAIAARAPGTAGAESGAESAGLAWFEDHWIDLAADWEGAAACDISPTGNVCFRSEAALDSYLNGGPEATTATSATLSITTACASALKLYDGTTYTGSVLNLSTEFRSLNLSTYGFDNITSSYKVGACDSDFYSAASGGGSHYGGNTNAFAQAATMLAGWDNVVSSVFIG